MGKSNDLDPSTSSTSHSSPSYTSQAIALHNGMGGPHPSATQTVQPINVTGEITDMPYHDNPPARITRESGSHRQPITEFSHISSSSSGSGSGSSSAGTPLQYSPPTSSGHAQAQGLHMGMAWARPHRTQPVRLYTSIGDILG